MVDACTCIFKDRKNNAFALCHNFIFLKIMQCIIVKNRENNAFSIIFHFKNQVTSHDLAQNLTFLHVDILNLQKIMNFQFSFSKNQVAESKLMHFEILRFRICKNNASCIMHLVEICKNNAFCIMHFVLCHNACM